MEVSWVDKLREWDYSIQPVLQWLWNIVLYNAERHGPIAYLFAAGIVVAILLSFPPTRGMTKTVCSSVLKMLILYVQLVTSLLTVQLIAFLARVSLTLFHKCRIWIAEGIGRFRKTD